MVKIDIKRLPRRVLMLILLVPWLVVALVLQLMVWTGDLADKIDKSNTISWLMDKTTLEW